MTVRMRTRKISHHKTWTSASAKLARLRAADPDATYYHRVNQDAAYMPHEIYHEEQIMAQIDHSEQLQKTLDAYDRALTDTIEPVMVDATWWVVRDDVRKLLRQAIEQAFDDGHVCGAAGSYQHPEKVAQTARCPVCESPAVPFNGVSLAPHQTLLGHDCYGSSKPIANL